MPGTDYSPKTLVSGWNFDESYPKDYDAFNPPGGDMHKSTHKRLGTWKENEMVTEKSLAQIAALAEPRGGSAKRALVNLLTFTETIGEHRKKHWQECGIHLPPETSFCTDYTSTYHGDYINFAPERPKIISRGVNPRPGDARSNLNVSKKDKMFENDRKDIEKTPSPPNTAKNKK